MGNPRQKTDGSASVKTTAKVAAAYETSTRIGATDRLFPRAFRPGRMSKFNNNRSYAKKNRFLQ
ncbi:MAG: hypothetical protein O4965_11700 [Trichodesmium sp. St19_bin1]|nr:hypothetical protein [Trichodesmium sp. St19_bin1]